MRGNPAKFLDRIRPRIIDKEGLNSIEGI